MAKGFWVKTSQTGNFKKVTGLFVKVSPSTWQSINDAWVKVKQTGTGTWQKWWESATNPDTPIEILTSYTTTTELLRLQGKNYHWTPAPSTLFYTFSYVNNTTSVTKTLTSSTSTSNPSTGSSITVPSISTYRTISKSYSDDEYNIGGLSTYKFTVTGTTSGGSTSVQTAEYSMRTPKAPILSVERLSGTSVKITITGATSDDFNATYRYIVSTYDAIGGTIESGGGRGGYSANSDPTYVTLTGMTAGRLYYIYVTPFTGSAGSTEANATGYAGITANTTTQGEADYTFSFGNTLHVGTNGYVSLDTASTSDSISGTTGRVIGIFPGDLYQDTTTSVWYWSDSTRFVIRWEGYHYNQASNLRQYEIVFNTGANYATVYAINVANTTEGIDAYVKDGVTKTSYPAALTTGAWRQVWFDGVTTPSVMFGPYVTTSKSVMKQVTGLTGGTQDQGYTSITTSTNQNVTPALGAFNVSSFTKGTVGSSSQGAARTTTLSWGSSSGATAYQIQYFGSNDNVNWTTVQAFSPTNNTYTTSDTKTWSTSGGNFGYYTFMKASVRALESTGTATYVYSDNGTYTEASGVAPGQPTFGTITKTNNTASIPFTVGTQGTNYLYTSIEYDYRASSGSYSGTWSTSVINTGAGTISLSGLSANTTYYIKIRTKNYDELYSPENETNFATTAGLSSPTISDVTYNPSSGSWTVNYTLGSGPYYQIWYQPVTSTSVPTLTATSATAADASSASASSTSKTATATSGYIYWWWVRSANALNATGSGNVSDWNGPVTMSPMNTASPTLTGTAKVGQILTYGAGTWVNANTYDLRLYRGTAGVATYETLAASSTSTSATYTIPSGDFTDTNNRKYYRSFVNASNPSFSSGFTAGTEIGPLVNLTLYTITFDSQSGTSVSSLTQATESGSISKPTDPTRTSYTFGGWSTSSTGTTAVSWPRTPSGDETLYAIWSADATAPATPTGFSHTKSYDYSSVSNNLTRVTSSQKRQDWTYSVTLSYNLSWSASTGATSYEVGYSTTTTAPSSATWTGITTTSKTDTWTQTDRGTLTYYYFVRAKNSAGTSAWSSAVGGTSTATVVSGTALTLVNATNAATSSASPGNGVLTYLWTSVSTTANHFSRYAATIAGTAVSNIRGPSSGSV